MQCNKDNQLTWLKRDHIQFLFFFFFFLCFCVFHLNLKLVLPRPNVTHLLPGIQILDAPIKFSKFQVNFCYKIRKQTFLNKLSVHSYGSSLLRGCKLAPVLKNLII
ncbi:hypothetical protein BRARA_B00300 [Brassica rapa]|uniref:Uncharacterized protein n=1 Tax=Brassica campestris TaxID=3711 RepID=A0A398A5L5_BRACM|nr:hypothetical protein BRARA_B00300 [Brassica rapa]